MPDRATDRIPRSRRGQQLHLWIDDRDRVALSALADHFREPASVVIRRLIRVASERLSSGAGARLGTQPGQPGAVHLAVTRGGDPRRPD